MAKLDIFLVAMVALRAFALAVQEEESLLVRIFKELHPEPEGPAVPAKQNIETLWIEQKLDHFDKNEKRTWPMRYMANKEFFKSGGPLFIFVGGEWSITPETLQEGHFYDLAKQHNGYLFYTEHRFYGESWPVDDMSNENMKYLNVKQALADLAHFIRSMKSTIPGMENSKSILAGYSYSGAMVTWFRKLYPELAAGCWASSAPLLAKLNFYEYKEVMGKSIKTMGGNDCHDRIERGIRELEFMFANKREADVKSMLGLCDTFRQDNDLDVSTLFLQISELFAMFVQTHYVNSIQTNCARIMEGSTDVIGVANFIAYTADTTEKGCVDMSYDTYLKLFTNITFNESNIMRQWTYQTCNEFGWFQTSDSMYQPFGTKFPLHFFTTLCTNAYGGNYTEEFIQQRINDTNEMFGGIEVDIENVYWTQGQLDPWIEVGKQNGTHTTVIPYHSHAGDLNSISDKDTPELRASKENIANLVREWLG